MIKVYIYYFDKQDDLPYHSLQIFKKYKCHLYYWI